METIELPELDLRPRSSSIDYPERPKKRRSLSMWRIILAQIWPVHQNRSRQGASFPTWFLLTARYLCRSIQLGLSIFTPFISIGNTRASLTMFKQGKATNLTLERGAIAVNDAHDYAYFWGEYASFIPHSSLFLFLHISTPNSQCAVTLACRFL